ncbi:glycosyltransferase [Pseudalkalibacillus decolorationis]|uniref:glycosyltransferase n=1 Tax=Pseudalkalibacillus decolorationis TaxID=163879 RepID=UPI002147CF1A|nr:glycosyltransferase [Pseudalkalibacillus decolorationis]
MINIGARPLVSVIVPFYNCPYIQSAIESVLNQTYSNVEIIVVNDGSTKHSELLQPFRDKIIYIEKENGGTATALNVGLKSANGDLIAWLSSDDRFVTDKLEKQVHFMKQTKADLIYTNYDYINEYNEITATKLGIPLFNKKDLLRYMIRNNPINGCTILAKRQALINVGLFDETLRYANDYDMWIKLAINYEVKFLDECLVRYRIHENMGSKKHSKEVMAEFIHVKNRYRLPLLNRIIQEKKDQ